LITAEEDVDDGVIALVLGLEKDVNFVEVIDEGEEEEEG